MQRNIAADIKLNHIYIASLTGEKQPVLLI